MRILLLPLMGLLMVEGLVSKAPDANAVIYCKYIGYPKGCVAAPGVRLIARPAGVGTVGMGTSRPGNRNGGVNRVGRRR